MASAEAVHGSEGLSKALLKLWTKKESIFKYHGCGSFSPQKIDTTQHRTVSFCLAVQEPLYVSLCADKADNPRYYLYENGTAKLICSDLRKSELEP